MIINKAKWGENCIFSQLSQWTIDHGNNAIHILVDDEDELSSTLPNVVKGRMSKLIQQEQDME